MKLNLGCGSQILPGYINVDKYGTPDLRWDLETFPWPFDDNAAEGVLLCHTLEHLGSDPNVFIAILKELYRVCRDGALVQIIVPHPRHDTFLIDPTHVRPVTPAIMKLFSRKANLEWQQQGSANTPLALYHGVDFELVKATSMLDEPFRTMLREKEITMEKLHAMEQTLNNIVVEIDFTLRVVKP